jgi:AcrR family transcriptional regulator
MASPSNATRQTATSRLSVAAGAPSAPTRNGNRTRRGADRRKEILSAARETFSMKGFERTSMAEIAAKVGVVEGALYKHFGGKRELLFEATRAFYEPLITATIQELAGVRGSRNRLRFVIFRQLQAFVSHPEMCRLIIQEIRPYADYFGSVVRDLNRQSTSTVVGILEEARRGGELRSEIQLALVRDVIFGGIEHLAWRALVGRGTIDVERQADELTRLIWNGLEPVADSESRADRLRADHEHEPELARLRVQIDRLEALVAQATKVAQASRPVRIKKQRRSKPMD